MPELEELLRDEVRRQSDAYVPTAGLEARIAGRVRAREQRHRALVGVAAAAACLVVALGVAAALVLPGDGGGEVRTDRFDGPTTTTVPSTTVPPPTRPTTTAPPPSSPTTTRVPPTQGTAPGPGGGTTTTTTEPTEGPGAVTSSTPLTRQGVGPIVAGMTVAEAEAESGNTITIDEPLDASGSCRTGSIDGTEMWLLMSGPGTAADGEVVIQAVVDGTSTAEGVALGATRAELQAAYGEPTEERDYMYDEATSVLVYEQGGFAYSARVDGAGVIQQLQSGLPEWVGNQEGCA
jgi:hypothetical protein